MDGQGTHGMDSDSVAFVDDDRDLAALGYKASFKREFNNFATVRIATVRTLAVSLLFVQISFAFSIMVRKCLLSRSRQSLTSYRDYARRLRRRSTRPP